MSKFSDTLKGLRKSKDYTQKQLAEMLGVAESTIGMYERGQREPSFETLEAIADIFNVYMSDLIEKKPAPQEDGPTNIVLSEAQKELLDVILQLDGERLRAVLDYAIYQSGLNNQ